MIKDFKVRIAFEVLMILLSLALLCLITRLWPLLLVMILGIFLTALRLLFLSVKKEENVMLTVVMPKATQMDTETDIVRAAFSILQDRITGHIVSLYPAVRWVWETPNPVENFASGLPLSILLNHAGGYRRAFVQAVNLQFCSLIYETAEICTPAEPPDDTDCENTADHTLTAFQWTDANLLILNGKSNEAIACGNNSFVIPKCDLPHPGSWPDICCELTRNGFAGAVIQDNGITVTLPK